MLEESKEKWPKIDSSRKALRDALKEWMGGFVESNATAENAKTPATPHGSRRPAQYVEPA